MKFLALYGSPHGNQSNSGFLLDTIINEILTGPDHTVTKCYLPELNIGSCINCGSCRRPGAKGCWQKDDMVPIAEAIKEADYIFMSSPLYWWNISADLKKCIDRFYGIPFSEFAGKTIHLVMAGESRVPNEGYDIVEASLSNVCRYIGVNFQSWYVSASTNGLPAANSEQLIKEAKEIGRKFL